MLLNKIKFHKVHVQKFLFNFLSMKIIWLHVYNKNPHWSSVNSLNIVIMLRVIIVNSKLILNNVKWMDGQYICCIFMQTTHLRSCFIHTSIKTVTKLLIYIASTLCEFKWRCCKSHATCSQCISGFDYLAFSILQKSDTTLAKPK